MNSTRSQHMKICLLLLAVYACVGLGEGSRHKMFSQPVARAMSLSHEHFGNDTAAMLADVHEELLMAALLAEPTFIPDAAASMAVVAQHNTLRARHGAGPLVWDDPLARLASKYARKCIFAADPGSRAGENIFLTGMTGASNTTFLSDAVNLWYTDGAAKYNYANPGFSSETGTFTQVVWKSTFAIGCAIQRCRNGVQGTPYDDGTLVICRYSPPGNVAGMYRTNVLPPSTP